MKYKNNIVRLKKKFIEGLGEYRWGNFLENIIKGYRN